MLIRSAGSFFRRAASSIASAATFRAPAGSRTSSLRARPGCDAARPRGPRRTPGDMPRQPQIPADVPDHLRGLLVQHGEVPQPVECLQQDDRADTCSADPAASRVWEIRPVAPGPHQAWRAAEPGSSPARTARPYADPDHQHERQRRAFGPWSNRAELVILITLPNDVGQGSTSAESAIRRWDGTHVQLRSVVGAGYRFTIGIADMRGHRLKADHDARVCRSWGRARTRPPSSLRVTLGGGRRRRREGRSRRTARAGCG
jgi:hypothetical protein